jgi:hypothetical protein
MLQHDIYIDFQNLASGDLRLEPEEEVGHTKNFNLKISLGYLFIH